MKKRSGHKEGAGGQLGLDLVVASTNHTGSPPEVTRAESQSRSGGAVLDLAAILERRATESDRALLKAVGTRANHLFDCLIKRP
jgi:hypothetical protein